MILMIWVTSIIVSLAPLFGWKDEDFEKRVNVDKMCMVSPTLRKEIDDVQ